MMKRRGRRASSPRHIVLLGPQSDAPTLPVVLRDLERAGHVSPDSPIAAITAGWRDREGEVGIIDPSVAERVVDLELYRRTERIAEADPELARAHRDAQNRLKLLRRAYNVRLAGLIDAHVRLAEIRGDEAVLAVEREDAVAAIRRLDEHHLERVAEIRAEYDRDAAPGERAAVRAERSEVESLLGDADAVLIAGGHIATLLNRLRLFGGTALFGGRAVIGWSAGAMALAPRVVLFHDRPPWGAGNPEVFDHGLGLADEVVALPDASERLALNDRIRTARLAARFAPSACVLLDPGARIDRVAGAWKGHGRVKRLDRAGRRIRFRTRAA